MSSLAYAPEATRPRGNPGALSARFSRNGPDVLLAVAVIALGAAFVAYLPSAFSVDSWLALVSGREVWQSGLPHHEVLTSLSLGAAWVDQQWLSELASYGLYRTGGLALLGVVNVGLIALGVGGAVAGARRLGARPMAVLAAMPVCLWLMIPSREVRTQEFAIPLFVATAYLLARDSRSPSRRVYWCLPILVLWGNLHGTVSLGAMLVALRGVTLAWERRATLTHSLGQWRRPLALALGAPLCLLLTPYGAAILSYYQKMFVDSSVRHAVTEWQPITSAFVIAGPFFVIAGIALWSFGRYPSRTTLWDRLALVALAAGSVMVIRNVLFFALLALLLLPVSIGIGTQAGATPVDHRRGRINIALVVTMLSALILLSAATFARPTASLELGYQRVGLLSAVQSATTADRSLKVLADVRFADWLLWRAPELSGRVANDARFELLSAGQIARMQSVFAMIGTDWKRGARGFRVIVLDRRYAPDTARAFLQEPGRRVLYDDGARLVILRTAGQSS